MRTLLAAFIAAIVLVAPAAAQPMDGEGMYVPPFMAKEKPAKVPTGIDVKGCKDYYIDKNGRVHNVCKKVVGERWWWFDALPHGGSGD